MDHAQELAQQWKLSQAYITTHAQLLCRPCGDRNKRQLAQAGITLDVVPCEGTVLCTLCDREIGA